MLREMKNGAPVEYPLCDTITNILMMYLNIRKNIPGEYLFCTAKGTQLNKNSLSHAIEKYNRERGVTKTSIHLYRHRWAKDFCRANGNIKKLQTLLNHKTLAMSAYYAQLYPSELREDVNQFNSLDLALKRNRTDMKEHYNAYPVNDNHLQIAEKSDVYMT